MASKPAPPPPIARETMLALLTVTSEFATARPWELMADCDVVGLTDPVSCEIRIASILGNGGEVFGVAIYRRTNGVRWIMNVLNDPEEGLNMDDAVFMDALKIEFMPKNEMPKEDLKMLKALDFKPTGRGVGWPQFQSSLPGWLPWYIDQTEAQQLLLDLPRLTNFCSLFQQHPNLFEKHGPSEIPFLPSPMPDQPLKLEDLDWRTLIIPPETFEPFKPSDVELSQLRSLKHDPKAGYEYGCRVMMGAMVLEKGRPSFSRVSLLVEHQQKVILGFNLSLASQSFVECAGSGLVEAMIKLGTIPGVLLIDDNRLEPILGPLCDLLNIDLVPSKLPGLEDAKASMENYMQAGRV